MAYLIIVLCYLGTCADWSIDYMHAEDCLQAKAELVARGIDAACEPAVGDTDNLR